MRILEPNLIAFNKPQTLTSLELFSGAGGLAKGLELAGFSHSAFVENNKHAYLTLGRNFDAAKVFFGDVRDFSFDRPVDIIVGGPPCQPFSLGGKHQAHQDARDMFPHAIRAVAQLTPKAFLFENVKGLLRPLFSDYLEYILLRLTYPAAIAKPREDWQEHLQYLRKLEPQTYAGLRYNVQLKLLNAADFGVPQTRERVFIVGLRSDLNLEWSFPQPTHSQDRLLWDMYVRKDYWDKHQIPERVPVGMRALEGRITELKTHFGLFAPGGLPWQTVRDALWDVPDPLGGHAIPDHLFRPGARTYPGHTGSDLDWPSKTLKAGGHGVPGGENMMLFPDGRVRYYTVYEAKKIQTFPADFYLEGAWGEAMRQIGNAVPVLLAEVLGRQLFRLLVAKAEMVGV